ncbi:MAG: YajD family HNH nuclease [Alphaproteobacteria bacterium]
MRNEKINRRSTLSFSMFLPPHAGDYRIRIEGTLNCDPLRPKEGCFEIKMSSKSTRSKSDELEPILAEARQLRKRRGNVYRDQALKILPWVCAWCGREFSSKKLHELTVHHKDHNHNNNPPDGSNWELLCMYCHDSEHSRALDREASGETAVSDEQEPPATYKPFADLKTLSKKKG